MGANGSQTVVSGDAATRLDANLAGFEVDFVVDDDQILRNHPVVTEGRADGPARLVHEGERLEKHHAAALHAPRGGETPVALPERTDAMPSGNRVDGHESDIVTVAKMGVAGVSEPSDQFHRWRFPAGENRPEAADQSSGSSSSSTSNTSSASAASSLLGTGGGGDRGWCSNGCNREVAGR